MDFKVEPINNKRYDLIKSNTSIGSILYQNLFSVSKAKIILQSTEEFYTSKKSNWKSDFYIMQDEKAVLEFSFKWNGSVHISSCFEEQTQKYILKRKGFWNSDYVLINEKNDIVCSIKPEFKWKKFKTSYHINILNDIDFTQYDVLFLSIIHCIILINTMAAVAT